MKIGIDVRALQWHHRFRGVGVYLSNLLEALSKTDHQNQYVLYGWDGPNPLNDIELDDGFKYSLSTIIAKPSKSLVDKITNRFKRQLVVRTGEVDVFLQPDIEYGLAKTDAPQITVAYDLIPILFRQQHYPNSLADGIKQLGMKHAVGNKLRWYVYSWSLSQYVNANRIIAISEATKKDLLSFDNRIRSAKVAVIPLAAGTDFYPVEDFPPLLKALGIKKPYLLYVGAADYRKNIAALVEDFEKLRRDSYDLQLVLVGKDFENMQINELRSLQNIIKNSTYHRDIKIVGYAPQKTLIKLYSGAKAFVFPSIYEGFGMPVLEAMACETPVVAYNTSSIPEVAGKAALLVKPGESLAPSINRILKEEKLRKQLIAAGKIQAKKFSWDNTAKMTLEVLRKAAK